MALELLFVHQNFPGQFRDLAPGLLERGHRITAIGSTPLEAPPEGIHFHCYPSPPAPAEGCLDPYLESRLWRARAVADLGRRLREEGLSPDAVVFHTAWGEGLHLRGIWPSARLIAYPELYGSPRCLGYGFHLPLEELSPATEELIDRQNLLALAGVATSDAAVVPTAFQRSTFPSDLQNRLQVIHEGVDLARIPEAPPDGLELPNGTLIRRGQPLLSFASRGLEPLRGFPQFLAALPALLTAHPTVQVVVAGAGESAYGSDRHAQGSETNTLLQTIREGPHRGRVHLAGTLPHRQLLQLFQLSWAHVYLTYPYALSWSLLEAMACGAPIVGSRGGPVGEVIQHQRQGLLVDFNSPGELAAAVLGLLLNPPLRQRLGRAARWKVEQDFDLRQSLARYESLLAGEA